jgi:hypothetical protein
VCFPPRQWGERYYYANDHRTGGHFAWFADNLRAADGAPRDEDITATWAFDGQWDPSKLPAVLPFASIPNPENGARWVDPAGVKLRWTPSRNAISAHLLRRDQSAAGESKADTGPLEPGKTYYWRIDDGPVWSFRADPRTTRVAL